MKYYDLVSSLQLPDITKPDGMQGCLSDHDAREIVNWMKNQTLPIIGHTLTNSRQLGNYHDYAVLLTPIPERRLFTRKIINDYKDACIPLIIFLQTHSELEWFVTEISNSIVNHPHLVIYSGGFGADISHKREYGSILAFTHGIKYLIHHDSDVDLNLPIQNYISEAKRLFRHSNVGVVSYPVKLASKGSVKDFKPKEWEEIEYIKSLDAYRSNYGTAGCFLIHKLTSTSDIWKHGGMVFSWVRGLYGEWVPFSGVLRTMGKSTYLPNNSELYSINKTDTHNSDPLLTSPSTTKAARILVSGAQTLLELGSEVEQVKRYLRSYGDNSHRLTLPVEAKLFLSKWETHYTQKKVNSKLTKGDLALAYQLAEKELTRRIPVALQQKQALQRYCQLNYMPLIPPLSDKSDLNRFTTTSKKHHLKPAWLLFPDSNQPLSKDPLMV